MNHKKISISTMSGGFKNIFAHGVLSMFEEQKFFADSYSACSSSAVPVAYAAFRRCNELPLSYWVELEKAFRAVGISRALLDNIGKDKDFLIRKIFNEPCARLIIACSRVTTAEAVASAQSEKHRHLGRQLLVMSGKKDSSWMKQHLEPFLFDTHSDDDLHCLTAANFADVFYATTRMLHGWPVPAAVNGEAFLDGTYTCICPVAPFIEDQSDLIIVIANEPVPIPVHMFTNKTIAEKYPQAPFCFIQPECDPKQWGVDIVQADQEGIKRVYAHGRECGLKFLQSHQNILCINYPQNLKKLNH